jgi:hypothetical protein
VSNFVWSEVENHWIREHATQYRDVEAAERLTYLTGREISISSYRKQRAKLGIKKTGGRGVFDRERDTHSNTFQ